MSRTFFAMMLAACALAWQAPEEREERRVRLPDGKLQRDEILKEDHEKTLRDAAELARLAGELRAEIESSDRQVLSLSAIKKTEEIEKLARRMRSRMKRY